jgi:arabinofuranosyltransferase
MESEHTRQRQQAAHKERSAWLGPSLLALSFGLLLEAAYRWWPRTVDDAFITFRYGQNLVAGLGPIYNAGEWVEGYSSPLWMLGSAAAIAVGADPVVASKCVGLFASCALSAAVYVALRATHVRHWGAGLAACAVGGNFVLQLWSVSGMETTTYAALLFAGLAVGAMVGTSIRGALLASGLLVAASLTHPEGLVFWVVGLGLLLLGCKEHRKRLLAYAAPGFVLVGHFLWRFAYYGYFFPNTYYAKTGGGLRMWRQGVEGFLDFIGVPPTALLMVVAVAGLVVGIRQPQTRRSASIIGGAMLFHLMWVISVGDDGLFKYRFYVPIVGPMAFLLGLLFCDPDRAPVSQAAKRRVARKGSHFRSPWMAPGLGQAMTVVAVLVTAIAVYLSILKFHNDVLPLREGTGAEYLEGNLKLGRHLAATRNPDTLIAVPSAGAIPFYSRLPTLDMYGLNDAHIAHQPFPIDAPGRMMKWDIPYTLSREPDLIVLNQGYQRAGVSKKFPIAAMDKDLIDGLEGDPRYNWTSIPFADGSRFFVWEKVADANPRP